MEVVLEDNETNTVIHLEKRRNKMKGVLRCLQDGRVYPLKAFRTKLGKNKCDINFNNNVIVEYEHAVIQYDNNLQCFVIEDQKTSHGTYVNDCRVQNSAVRLSHGDIIRLGHGGPRLEVQLEILKNPPVADHYAWHEIPASRDLPYLIKHSTPYSTVSYGRNNGYHGHNKTISESPRSTLVPRPPQSSRPTTANPSLSNGFKSSSRPQTANVTFSSVEPLQSSDDTFGRKSSNYVSQMDAHLTKMEENLIDYIASQNEKFHKESIISKMRNEVATLRHERNRYDSFLQEDYKQRLSSLQHQVTQKDNEMRSLHKEIQKLKTSHDLRTTNQIAELKTLLARHEHSITVLETELKSSKDENLHLNVLIGNLRNEINGKDAIVKQTKTNTEKYHVCIRNKELEIDALKSKFLKQDDIVRRDMQCYQDDILLLNHKIDSLNGLLKERDVAVKELSETLVNTNDNLRQTELNENSLQERLGASHSHYETNMKKLKLQVENLQDRQRLFQQKLLQLLKEDGNRYRSFVDDEDIYRYITDIIQERDGAIDRADQMNLRLSNVLHEKNMFDKYSTNLRYVESLRMALGNTEKRLFENGRTCKNLRAEQNRLENVQAPKELNWIKDFVVSLISQEYAWEQGIEGALDSFSETTCDDADPSMLIKQLKTKMSINRDKIISLEDKINVSEMTRASLYDEIKQDLKDKYKRKTEKVLKDLKESEEIKFEVQLRKMKEKEEVQTAAALAAQRESFEIKMGDMSELSDKIHTLKNEHHTAREEFATLQKELREARRNEASLLDCLKEMEQSMAEKQESMKREQHQQYKEDIRYYKGKIDDYEKKIGDLENTIMQLNQDKKEVEFELLDTKHAVKESSKKHDLKKKAKKDDDIRNLKIMADLQNQNEDLRHQLNETKEDCKDQKEIVHTLTKDLNGVSNQLTDLKGEITDKRSNEIEVLKNKIKGQEDDIVNHRKQLLQLSDLADEQKRKLIEQESQLAKQNNLLALQSEGLRDVIIREKGLPKYSSILGTSLDRMAIADRCLSLNHDKTIEKQKLAISDLQKSLNSLEHLQPPTSSSQELAIYRLKKELRLNKTREAKPPVHDSFNEEESFANNREDIMDDESGGVLLMNKPNDTLKHGEKEELCLDLSSVHEDQCSEDSCEKWNRDESEQGNTQFVDEENNLHLSDEQMKMNGSTDFQQFSDVSAHVIQDQESVVLQLKEQSEDDNMVIEDSKINLHYAEQDLRSDSTNRVQSEYRKDDIPCKEIHLIHQNKTPNKLKGSSPKLLEYVNACEEDPNIYALREEFSFSNYNKPEQSSYLDCRAKGCRCKELLVVASDEFEQERLHHRETQEALHACESIYLRFVRAISAELDIDHVTGCKPIGFLDSSDRQVIIEQRKKGLEIILERIQVTQSRIERKDQFLVDYDKNLKALREKETFMGEKVAQIKDLEIELGQFKGEVNYLQEALKKARNELDQQRRLNALCLQKKVTFSDKNVYKVHDCYVDEQKQYKENCKVKRKMELLKKKDYEIHSLKQELDKKDAEICEKQNQEEDVQDAKEEISAPVRTPNPPPWR